MRLNACDGAGTAKADGMANLKEWTSHGGTGECTSVDDFCAAFLASNFGDRDM